MSDLDTDALRSLADKAHEAIANVAMSGGRIHMRVPADPEHDTDLIVSDLSHSAIAAADTIDALRNEVARLNGQTIVIDDLTGAEQFRRRAKSAEAERDALRRIIAEAPHGFDCYLDPEYPEQQCDCWKSRIEETQ